jgi:hypothetical protein
MKKNTEYFDFFPKSRVKAVIVYLKSQIFYPNIHKKTSQFIDFANLYV